MRRIGLVPLLCLGLFLSISNPAFAQTLEENLATQLSNFEVTIDAALADLEFRMGGALDANAATSEADLNTEIADLESRLNDSVNALDLSTALTDDGLQTQIDDINSRIDDLHPVGGASCADLAFSGNVWGVPAQGLDLRAFTNSTLHFTGCNGNGCAPINFFCFDNAIAGTLSFGSTNDFLRVQVDPGNVALDVLDQIPGVCSSAGAPNGISNFEADDATASALCQALGYAAGTSTDSLTTNSCPQASPVVPDGSDWTLSNLAGAPLTAAQQIHCTGGGS